MPFFKVKLPTALLAHVNVAVENPDVPANVVDCPLSVINAACSNEFIVNVSPVFDIFILFHVIPAVLNVVLAAIVNVLPVVVTVPEM